MAMPKPASRSQPAIWMSIAVAIRCVDTCAALCDGLIDFTSAAMAPACGAAADVPKKVANPDALVETPSAAVRSGLARTMPPLADRLPGVSAAPAAVKKMRRGPSELNVSTGLAAVNDELHGPFEPAPAHAGVAATPN